METSQSTSHENICKQLWGGTITQLTHDLCSHSLVLVINVLDSGVSSVYKLTLLNMSELKITNEHPDEDWDYVEITELSIRQKETSVFLVFDLWSSSNLYICCKTIKLETCEYNNKET